jgi:hypothetical protein
MPEEEVMTHPEVDRARERWEVAYKALREARAMRMASATEANSNAVDQAELAVARCEAEWEARLNEHGGVSDMLPFRVAQRFPFGRKE